MAEKLLTEPILFTKVLKRQDRNHSSCNSYSFSPTTHTHLSGCRCAGICVCVCKGVFMCMRNSHAPDVTNKPYSGSSCMCVYIYLCVCVCVWVKETHIWARKYGGYCIRARRKYSMVEEFIVLWPVSNR